MVLSSSAEIFVRGFGVGVDLTCWADVGACKLEGVEDTLGVIDFVPVPGGTSLV